MMSPHLPEPLQHLAIELDQWLRFGQVPPDPFLLAILRNDLGATVALSDEHSTWGLVRPLMRFLWAYLPKEAYGSGERLARWEKQGGTNGRPRDLEDRRGDFA